MASAVPEEALPPGTPTIRLARRWPSPSSATSACSTPRTPSRPRACAKAWRARSSIPRSRRATSAPPTTRSSAWTPRRSCPGRAASLTAAAACARALRRDGPRRARFPRTSDLRLVLTQPLLRGFGPNATFFELRNSRRGREGQERHVRAGPAAAGRRGDARVLPGRSSSAQLLAVARQSLRAQREPAPRLRGAAARWAW